MGRSTLGLWWQECQLPTANWFTDITSSLPNRLAQRMEVSLSSFRPNPGKGLAITLLERTGVVLLVF